MLRIGDVHIEHPFVQAALSGHSDLPMRRVARRFGAAYTVNEMALDTSVLHESSWRTRLLNVEADDHPVGGQLMGANPDAFGPAAALLSDAGYDVIDINFGCPVPKAMKRCRGGYLLSQPAEAMEIIRRVLEAVGARRPVTVKMRRGLDDTAASERSFFEIFDGAFDLGVSAITVHGRTVEQKYRGPSDWAFLKKVKRHAGDRVVLGSGDLFSAEDCVRMMRETGVDGVTIARGAIGNPWIFGQCLALIGGHPVRSAPTMAQMREVVAYHVGELVRYHEPKAANKIVGRLMNGYTRYHPRPKAAREAFSKLKSVEDMRAVFDDWYPPDSIDDTTCASRVEIRE